MQYLLLMFPLISSVIKLASKSNASAYFLPFKHDRIKVIYICMGDTSLFILFSFTAEERAKMYTVYEGKPQ